MTTTNPREPSLAETRDWYEERANDPRESPGDRRMWQLLADEITNRLGDRKPNDSDALF